MGSKVDLLARSLQEAIDQRESRKTSGYDTKATVVRKEGDTLWVHIPGGTEETPVQRTVDAEENDEIMVRVANGKAWAMGNQTSPPSDNKVAYRAVELVAGAVGAMSGSQIDISGLENFTGKNSKITDAVINNANIVNSSINNLKAENTEIRNSTIENFRVIDGVVQDLRATDATIQGKITAAEADINDLVANKANVTDLQAANARIENLTATKADITDLTAANAQIDNLRANKADIDLANVNNAWIQNGVIKNGAIADAQIIGVSANKLTAGTIDASDITVTNLNADNITTGTINGQRIGTGSLSLDKLAEEVPTKDYLDNVAENLQGQIDGQIETWTGTTVPTLQNSPAVNWQNTSERHKHVGDIYYVVNAASEVDGYTYRFTESGTSPNFTYAWTLIKDNQITKALQDILDMQGDISGIKTFDSQISSWKTDTDEELSSLKSRTSTLETDMGTKVSTTTFNELSQTVDENSASITSLGEIVNVVYVPTTDTVIDQSKTYYIYSSGQYIPVENPVAADLGLYFEKSTTQEVSNTVNTVKQTATSLGTTISQLTTTLGTNADGTTKANDIVHRASDLEQDLSGFKTTVSETYYTKTEGSNVEGRVTTAESTLTQHATSIAAKVSKDGVIAAINASVEEEGGSAVQIQANKVNIEGAAIFTGSGRLSQSSLNAAYDANGAASGAISALTTDLASGTGTTVINGGHIATGTLLIGQIDGLQTSLDGKQPTGDYATNTTVNNKTKYLTYIDSTNGIRVHDGSGDPAALANFAQVNSNGLQIYKGGSAAANLVASFGETVQIGKNSANYLILDSTGASFYDNTGINLFIDNTSGANGRIRFGNLMNGNGYSTIADWGGQLVIKAFPKGYDATQYGVSLSVASYYSGPGAGAGLRQFVSINGVYLTVTANGVASYFGSQGSNFCHIYSDASNGFAFNKSIAMVGAGTLGTAGYPAGTVIIGKATVGTNTYADANPKVIFRNVDGSQCCSLTFTDYDSVQAPASLTLNGNQGGEYFIAPHIKATGTVYGTYVNGSTYVIGGYLQSNGPIYLRAGAWLYSRASDTDNWRALVAVSSSAHYFFGYGSYAGSHGETFVDGHKLNLRAHSTIAANQGITAQGTITATGTLYSGGNTMCSTDNAQYCGNSGHRWKQVWAVDTTIRSSDRKDKDILGSIDFAEDLIMSLDPVEYMWKTGDHRRKRMGFVAQDVAEVCKSINENLSLVVASYGDEGEDTEVPYYGDEVDDNLLRWGLAYDELIAPMIKVMQKQQQEIEYLKSVVNSLVS